MYHIARATRTWWLVTTAPTIIQAPLSSHTHCFSAYENRFREIWKEKFETMRIYEFTFAARLMKMVPFTSIAGHVTNGWGCAWVCERAWRVIIPTPKTVHPGSPHNLKSNQRIHQTNFELLRTRPVCHAKPAADCVLVSNINLTCFLFTASSTTTATAISHSASRKLKIHLSRYQSLLGLFYA